MDRRSEPRIHSYQAVELTVLGKARFSCTAHVVDLSGHGLRLVINRAIPVNAAVKVQSGDWLFLGETCYCRQDRSHFTVGIEIDQVLSGLAELTELNRQLTGSPPHRVRSGLYSVST